MDYMVYGLTLFPLLAFLFAVTKMMTARRLYQGNGIGKRDADELEIKGRFFVTAFIVFTNVIFGILETAIIYFSLGSFNAPESMKYICLAAFVCTGAACVLQGVIGEREISKGMLLNGKGFSVCIIKMLVPEVITAIGFVYFLLGFVGVV